MIRFVRWYLDGLAEWVCPPGTIRDAFKQSSAQSWATALAPDMAKIDKLFGIER